MPAPPKPRSDGPHSLSSIASSLGLAAGRGPVALLSGWQRAAGPVVSRRCRPAGLAGAVLELEAPDDLWAGEIRRNEGRLIAALRACGVRVRAIRCRIVPGGGAARAARTSAGGPGAVPAESAAGALRRELLGELIERLRDRQGGSPRRMRAARASGRGATPAEFEGT